MLHVPYEIIELILEELYQADDAASLRSCSLASLALSSAAQPKLFRRVIIEIYCDTHEHSTSPFASLFSLLTSSSHLASLIHHFGVMVSSRWPGEVLYAPWIAEDVHLTLLFPLLTNLKRFGVYPSMTRTGLQHKIKWNDFSESAQTAIDSLLKRGDVESMDLAGFLLISGERLSGLRGLRELALSRVYLPRIASNNNGGASDDSNKQEERIIPHSQLYTLAINFAVRHGIPGMLEWVRAGFDCTQLRELILELPSPAGPGLGAETAIYGFIGSFTGTLRTLSVDLGTIAFNKYNQLGYRISEGSSIPPDWSSLIFLRSLALKVDATTKFFLYEHIDWFTNPLPFVVGLLNNMTRFSPEAAAGAGISEPSQSSSHLSSSNLQHFHLHVKFTNFLLRLIASNHISWGDLFSLLLSPLRFPELRYVGLTFLGLGEAVRSVLEGQVRAAFARSVGNVGIREHFMGKHEIFWLDLRFVDEKVAPRGVLERLPRI